MHPHLSWLAGFRLRVASAGVHTCMNSGRVGIDKGPSAWYHAQPRYLEYKTPHPTSGPLYCGPRLRKGEVFAYVGLPQNLKDLKARPTRFLQELEKGHTHASSQTPVTSGTGPSERFWYKSYPSLRNITGSCPGYLGKKDPGGFYVEKPKWSARRETFLDREGMHSSWWLCWVCNKRSFSVSLSDNTLSFSRRSRRRLWSFIEQSIAARERPWHLEWSSFAGIPQQRSALE